MNKNIIPTFFLWDGYVLNELLACTIWGVVFVPCFFLLNYCPKVQGTTNTMLLETENLVPVNDSWLLESEKKKRHP